jgi:hypothetical protein
VADIGLQPIGGHEQHVGSFLWRCEANVVVDLSVVQPRSPASGRGRVHSVRQLHVGFLACRVGPGWNAPDSGAKVQMLHVQRSRPAASRSIVHRPPTTRDSSGAIRPIWWTLMRVPPLDTCPDDIDGGAPRICGPRCTRSRQRLDRLFFGGPRWAAPPTCRRTSPFAGRGHSC